MYLDGDWDAGKFTYLFIIFGFRDTLKHNSISLFRGHLSGLEGHYIVLGIKSKLATYKGLPAAVSLVLKAGKLINQVLRTPFCIL